MSMDFLSQLAEAEGVLDAAFDDPHPAETDYAFDVIPPVSGLPDGFVQDADTFFLRQLLPEPAHGPELHGGFVHMALRDQRLSMIFAFDTGTRQT